MVTGHADGTLRFWDASSTTMQSLYKVRTSKFFERTKSRPPDDGGGAGVTNIEITGTAKVIKQLAGGYYLM